MKQINYFIFLQENFVFLVRKQKWNTLIILITKRLLIIELSEGQKLFFTNEAINKKRITLIENGVSLSNSQIISKTLLLFFWCSKKIGIWQYQDPAVDTSNIGDQLLKAIAKYKNHPSIRLIQESFKDLIICSLH